MKKKLKIIAVSPEVYDKLKNYGRAGDSFNDAITNLLEEYETRRKYKK